MLSFASTSTSIFTVIRLDLLVSVVWNFRCLCYYFCKWLSWGFTDIKLVGRAASLSLQLPSRIISFQAKLTPRPCSGRGSCSSRLSPIWKTMKMKNASGQRHPGEKQSPREEKDEKRRTQQCSNGWGKYWGEGAQSTPPAVPSSEIGVTWLSSFQSLNIRSTGIIDTSLQLRLYL